MKKQVWFKTNLDYDATHRKLRESREVTGVDEWKGRLTFYFKDFLRVPVQITTHGKLGITYPEDKAYEKILERVKLSFVLVKDDGTPAEILEPIKTPSESRKISAEENQFCLNHSKRVLNGLLAIYCSVPQIPPLSNILTEEQKEKLGLYMEPELLDYALAHLESGYPDVFKIYKRFRYVMNKINNVLTEMWTEILDETETITGRPVEHRPTNVKLEKLSTLEEEKLEIMDKLDVRIKEIIWKVIDGEPLDGTCPLCSF
jgi:hypothetical protein